MGYQFNLTILKELPLQQKEPMPRPSRLYEILQVKVLCFLY